MTRYFFTLFHVLLLLLLHASGFSVGFNGSRKSGETKCRKRERQALLNFKESLIDDYGILSTWSDDHNNTNCCKWKGIQCNDRTGHVHVIDLPSLDDRYLKGAINLTSLIHLKYIQHLDLSNNYFPWSHVPQLIGSFTNLRYLNLSFSDFGGHIPSELGNLSQLQYLDLGSNILVGPIPFQIGNLSHLQYLDLRDNYLSGEIPFEIGNLKQLQYLDLVYNILSGAIPFRNGNLLLLHTLRLHGNFDIKAEDAEWLSNLSSLTFLELNSLYNLSSSRQWQQSIRKFIPNLKELKLIDCFLSDADIKSLFYSHSNFSTSLTVLDLSSNLLTSSTFQLLFNFSLNLQELYLSNNNIALLSSLHPNFPSLKILDLSFNNLTSSLFQGHFNFPSKLDELHLRNCSLTDRSFLVSSASTLNSSSSLLFLDLSHNLLNSPALFYPHFNFTTLGPIPNGFGKVMNFLELLDLSHNKLQGKIPSFFANMCRLQSLYLSNNMLNGEISHLIQNSSGCNRRVFQSLDLSYNQITGKIPESIQLLSELEYLSLEGNSLEGIVTESHLSNFSKLEDLYLSYNSLSLKFVSGWIPPFRLSELGLASCKLGPSFPGWLRTQSSLMYLDISENGLNESVPDWFWSKLQIIYELNMSNNNLFGSIPNIPLKLYGEPFIFLSSNKFEKKVPSFFRQASELVLSQNKFSDLSEFLCNQSTTANVATLDLSKNQMRSLPDCWKFVDSLKFVDLGNNKLSGNIPISMGNLVYLEVLVLRNNSLRGELPSSLKNCSNLIMLDVGENMLSGPIPTWFGESMQQVIILIMRGNDFSGNLPIQLCKLSHIQLLDLSKNKLSKGIPKCLKNFTAMSEKSINRTETQSRIRVYNITYYEIYDFVNVHDFKFDITWMWKGVEQEFSDPQLKLQSIDLSCNNLTGEIPNEVVYLLGLKSLNLSGNNLSGEIPSDIGNLSSLESLDLSRNQLYGRIPSSLSQIDFLGKLDLSHNSLSGRIPLGRHLDTFDASCFEGNIDLCGDQLNKSCPGDQLSVKPPEPEVYGEDSVFHEALYMSLGIGYFTGFLGLIGSLLWQSWRNVYLKFLNKLTNQVMAVLC